MDTSSWSWQWIARTLPALRWENLSACGLISLYALWINCHALRDQFRARRALAANPSGRAGIFAALDKRMHAATKNIWRLAMVYLTHALVLWSVDAVIGFREVAHDLADEEIREQMNVDFYIDILGIVVSITATMILAPLLQMSLAAWLVSRFARKSGAATLEPYIPAARVLTTHMAFLWFMLLFAALAFWPPVTEAYLSRGVLMQAALGSGLAWGNAAHVFNYRVEQIRDVKWSWPGSTKALHLFASKIVAVHSSKGATEGLPQYVDHVEEEEVLVDEKA